MSYPLDDTIAAIASAPGGAARGIVRLSGPDAVGCVEACFARADTTDLRQLSQPTIVPGQLTLPNFAAPLDCDLYLWPGTRSYTRQPTAELHTLGSPPLLQAALDAVCAAGARPARPGEFTLRAFLAGRLDLTQAEAVLGVIDAGDDREFRVALRQMAGGLAGPLNQLRDDLLNLLAHLEAGLDFVEEDIEFISRAELTSRIGAAQTIVSDLLARMTTRGESTDLPRAVLVGWPNVGKSSLFNALVGRDGAIVSPAAGTTRDYLAATLDLAGLACQLVDTAGVEPEATPASIAAAAQTSSLEQHDEAHVRLLCLDATRPLNAWEREQLAKMDSANGWLGSSETSPQSRATGEQLLIWTKCDARDDLPLPIAGIETSTHTGTGLAQLRARLRDTLVAARSHDSDAVAGTVARSRESLHLAADSLARAQQAAAPGGAEELVADDVRIALHALGQVVGAVYTNDVLDRIFSRFCIGK